MAKNPVPKSNMAKKNKRNSNMAKKNKRNSNMAKKNKSNSNMAKKNKSNSNMENKSNSKYPSPIKVSEPTDNSDSTIENELPNPFGTKRKHKSKPFNPRKKSNLNYYSPIKNSESTSSYQLISSPESTSSSESTASSKSTASIEPAPSPQLTTSSDPPNSPETKSNMEKSKQLPDPKIDSAFKYIYGSQGSENIAKCFANDIFGPEMEKHFNYIDRKLHSDYSEIQHLKLKKCTLGPNQFRKKTGEVDMMFDDQDEAICILEMQNAFQRDFLSRMMFYGAKTWSNQLNAGENYDLFKNVSMIVITTFDLFPQEEDYLRYHPIMSLPIGKKGDIRVVGRMACINLAKFKVPFDQLKTNIERWCYFLKHPAEKNQYDINNVIGEYEILRDAYSKCSEFYGSPRRLTRYEREKQSIDDKKRDWHNARNEEKAKEKVKTQKEKVKTQKEKMKAQKEKMKAQKEKTKAQKAKAELEEMKAEIEKINAREETRRKAEETRRKAEETQRKAEETRKNEG